MSTNGVSETRPAPPPTPPLDAGAFAPGTMLADRYRIVALAGRGGMGEVYRAEDLRLGQTVALKFLPAALERGPAARGRLLAEVRNARTVSHPNVCRVYDIGELRGRSFMTMEYIDGEDLASLLRRIGRLPPDKALDVARQLSAGLAAAHDKGVLHRDLKPANVMIDGRGQARITDFGLAAEAGPATSPADFAGTVAYMAPERFHGIPATVQSDLYSLGLILYEICTGKPAFKGTTAVDWQRLHTDSTPTSPSALVAEINPAVERAILRCLEKEPARRPASAAQVAAWRFLIPNCRKSGHVGSCATSGTANRRLMMRGGRAATWNTSITFETRGTAAGRSMPQRRILRRCSSAIARARQLSLSSAVACRRTILLRRGRVTRISSWTRMAAWSNCASSHPGATRPEACRPRSTGPLCLRRPACSRDA